MKKYKQNNQISQETKLFEIDSRKSIGCLYESTNCLYQQMLKSQIKQFERSGSERERERITQAIIMVHSLPELHPVLINLLRFHYVTNNILQTHINKEVILTSQEHTPSLINDTQSQSTL